jgi:hypothetical protein
VRRIVHASESRAVAKTKWTLTCFEFSIAKAITYATTSASTTITT